MHFSLVKMNPPDALPSHGFDDAILPLYFALKSLGFEVEILFNRVNRKSRNIVFGSCIAPRRIGRMLPKGSIIFNLEQANRESKWCNRDYLTHLGDFTVWDYSRENADLLNHMGIPGVVHVPLGYVPEMTRLDPDFPPDVDVLFYGLVTDRRDAMLKRLVAEGVHTLASQDAFGDLRDNLLAHARIILNIHQFLPARLEVVRLGYVWANRKAVLSERREDTEIPDYLLEACCFAPYDALPEAAQRLLSDPIKLRRQAQRGFDAFASLPMAIELKKLLGRRAHTVSVTARETAAALPPRAFHASPVREWFIGSEG